LLCPRQKGTATRAVTEILPHEATSRLAAYKRDVLRALPDVEKMILFGSRARNHARTDSDYDIAVVVRDLSDRRRIRRILSNLAYDHILTTVFIRPIPLPSDYLEPPDGGQPSWPKTSSATAWKSREFRSRPSSGILAKVRSAPSIGPRRRLRMPRSWPSSTPAPPPRCWFIWKNHPRSCYGLQPMATPQTSDPVLARFRTALETMYGPRLERVVLYGSRARGDARKDSDYDVAVFVRDMPDRFKELYRLADLSTDLIHETGAFAHVMPYRAAAYAERTPLMGEIRRECVDF
jgi:predicted nucleotidyltransferase